MNAWNVLRNDNEHILYFKSS